MSNESAVRFEINHPKGNKKRNPVDEFSIQTKPQPFIFKLNQLSRKKNKKNSAKLNNFKSDRERYIAPIRPLYTITINL